MSSSSAPFLRVRVPLLVTSFADSLPLTVNSFVLVILFAAVRVPPILVLPSLERLLSAALLSICKLPVVTFTSPFPVKVPIA